MTEELTSLLQPLCSVFHPVFTEIPSPTQGIPESEASVPGVAMQHWHHMMMTKNSDHGLWGILWDILYKNSSW